MMAYVEVDMVHIGRQREADRMVSLRRSDQIHLMVQVVGQVIHFVDEYPFYPAHNGYRVIYIYNSHIIFLNNVSHFAMMFSGE